MFSSDFKMCVQSSLLLTASVHVSKFVSVEKIMFSIVGFEVKQKSI